jgi:glycine/D-amino acid oxidase-like deaminating enzyme
MAQISGTGDGKGLSSSTSTWSSLPKRDDTAIGRLRAAGVPRDLDWFDPATTLCYEEMGDPSTTAQVHPLHFTTTIANLAVAAGAVIRTGCFVTDIEYTRNRVRGVTYIERDSGSEVYVEATDVVLAAGPWTSTIFPAAPVSALRAHSVTIRTIRPVSAYAIFTEITLPPSFSRSGASASRKDEGVTSPRRRRTTPPRTVAPEIYARPNDEVYACGEGDTLRPLPATADLVEVDRDRCQDVVDFVSSISPELAAGTVLKRQACYLPTVKAASGGPLVGETGVKGLLLATGHTCWGIQNGPGTGKIMSEFVFDGQAISADIRSLDPRRVV